MLRRVIFLILATFCLPLAAAAQVPTYTVIDLGLLPGAESAQARGVNDSGQVVGETRPPNDGPPRAFIYSDGRLYDLGDGRATGINGAGQVAGYALNASGQTHAFRYSDGQMHDLGALPSTGIAGYSTAHAINNSGQVAGCSAVAQYAVDFTLFHVFLYGDGQMHDLGTPPGNRTGCAYGLNNSGQVVGQGDAYAFLYSDGVMRELGALGGGGSLAADINDHGQVVGYAENASRDRHAFLYSEGAMTDLGALDGRWSEATAINNSGQVVGTVLRPNRRYFHAFVYSEGVMRDLNDLIPADSGWDLAVASDINNVGQIVGSGILNGRVRAFLLTPVTTQRGGPQLLTWEHSARAIALDSVTLLRDPLPIETAHNFSPDRRTRVMLLARGMGLRTGEGVSAVTAWAEDSRGDVYTLPVEAVAEVPNIDGVTQVNLRLADELAGGGQVWVSISVRGATSNKALVLIKPAEAGH